MLVELNFDFTVAHIVEFALKRFTENKGLLIPIEMSYSYYDNEDDSKDYRINKWIYLLFHRPNNYTRVFSIVTDKPIWSGELGENQQWHLECDHDSCWSTDGFSFIKRLKDKIVKDFENNNIEYRRIHESVRLEEIQYVEFGKYQYKGYDQREIKINFKTMA